VSGTTITRIRRALLTECKKEADPTRALQQQAYMKSVMPYLGVTMPMLRSAAKSVFTAHPIHALEASMDVQEFLLRKAIGRALREYSPTVAIDCVEKHGQRLSNPSKREVLKILKNQELVSSPLLTH